MSRLRWLASSPKSLLQKFLCPQTISVQSSNGVICGRLSQFQRAFLHSTGAYHSMERDNYEILGISNDATRDEIKKAFHSLAEKYHPNANKNNPTAKRKFQEIRHAMRLCRILKKKPNMTR